jgi:hypothetical protein
MITHCLLLVIHVLEGFHHSFQLIEFFVPHLAERFYKIGYFFHFIGIKVIDNFTAVLFRSQQFTFGKDLKVFGNGRSGGVEIGSDSTGVIDCAATSIRIDLLVGSAIAWNTSLLKFIV